MFASNAYADIPYYFLKISCSKDLHFLSMQTFMLWNVCGGDSPYGGDCSKLSSLQKQGIYEVGAVHKDPSILPKDCDLGFGKIAHVTLDNFGVNERNGSEHGWYTVAVNEKEIASLAIYDDIDLRVIAWRHPHFDKNANRELIDNKTHKPILFPRIDVNICKADGRNSISLPHAFSCSFRDLSDDSDGFSFPERSRSYEAK
jgi:hypothetical protein